jgi:hypothetical protein
VQQTTCVHVVGSIRSVQIEHPITDVCPYVSNMSKSTCSVLLSPGCCGCCSIVSALIIFVSSVVGFIGSSSAEVDFDKHREPKGTARLTLADCSDTG